MRPGDYKALIDNGLQGINVAIPCIVTAFIQNGTDEPFVNVIPSIRRKNYNDERQIEYEDKEEIEEVPIGYFSTSTFAITIPIKEGDRGYLVASDFNLDNWDIDGEAIADSFDSNFKNFGSACWFIPGLWPRPKGLDGYSQEGLVLRTLDNRTNITLKDGEISINADTIIMNGIPIVTVNPQDPPFDTLGPSPELPKEIKR